MGATPINVQNYRPRGVSSLLNITSTVVVKPAPGMLGGLIVIAPGGSGVFTLNDCASVGAATTANELFTIAFNATGWVAGASYAFEFPFQVGLTVSAVPGSGSPQVNICFS